MIKLHTIGAIDRVIVNPTLQYDEDMFNYSFIPKKEGTYLIANTLSGDDSYKEDVKIPAGEYCNGYLLDSIAGLELVIDEKHINYGSEEDYDDIEEGDILIYDEDTENGGLMVASDNPTEGVYFKVTKKTRLTEKAFVVKIFVVDKDTVAEDDGEDG